MSSSFGISVIMPAYNHEAFIDKTIESVLQQSHTNFELIIVDDGSTDDTYKIAKKYELLDHRVKVFTKVNGGAHDAINYGVKKSQYDWLTVINSDDIYHINRLRSLAQCVYSENTLIITAFELIDDDGEIISNSTDKYVQMLEDLSDDMNRDDFILSYDVLLKNYALSTGNLFFHRKLFNMVEGFSELKYCHDWKFVFEALKYTDITFLPEKLYKYRVHASNSYAELGDVAHKETTECYQTLLLDGNKVPTKKHYPSKSNLVSSGRQGIYEYIKSRVDFSL